MKSKNTHGKNTIFLMLLIAGVMSMAQFGVTKEVELRVITSDAPLRLEPKAGSTVVSKVKIGAVLTAESKSGAWYRINLPPDEDGYVISGYMHQDNVKFLDEAAATPQAEHIKEEFGEKLKVHIIAEEADIREAPDAKSKLLGQAPNGTMLETEEKQGPWYKVAVAANVYGYIHQGQLEVLGGPIATEPPPEEKPREIKQAQTQPTPVAQAADSSKRRKISLKLTLGFGFGFESIETGAYKIYDDRTEPVTLHPGGGGNFGVDLGYLFTENMKLELGIGYQNSGVVAGDEQVSFTRMPLTLTLSYKFPSPRSFNVYVGAGGGLYAAPEVKYDVDNVDINIKYGSSFGLHGLVGLVKRPKGKNWFFFGELRYVAVFNYKWEEATYHGSSFPIYSSESFYEFGANGIFVNFGIGWLF